MEEETGLDRRSRRNGTGERPPGLYKFQWHTTIFRGISVELLRKFS